MSGKLFLGPAFFLLILFSCKTEKINPEDVDMGYHYYPIETGMYRIYEVEETQYVNGTGTTSNYFLKELIADPVSFNGEIRYTIHRSKTSDTLNWPSPFSTTDWSVTNNGKQLIEVVNNKRFIKLSFPVKEGKWNGNAFNTLGEDEYQMENPGKAFAVNSVEYSNTVKVTQEADTNNVVKYDYRVEVFAKDIGLVYKQNDVYEYQQTGGNTDTTSKFSGMEYKAILIKYGKE
jgi:hypothetical protein